MHRSRRLLLVAAASVAGLMAVVFGVTSTTGSAHRAQATTEPLFKTAADFIAAGKEVPGMHPTLPICPRLPADPGFPRQADQARIARQARDVAAPAACQADRTTGLFQSYPQVLPPQPLPGGANKATKAKKTRRLMHSGNAYHWSGPAGTAYNKHGVSSIIETVNPNVDHGGAREFVNGRSYALAGDTVNHTEAGWTERSAFADDQYAYGCGTSFCYYDTSQQFPLTVSGWYWYRVYHCGDPGEALVCGDIYYDEAWRNLWTSDATKCTNANETGNCLVENRSEVVSDDATPHPAFGGSGMSFAVGELMLDTMWDQWTTAYSTTVTSTSPYVIDWGTQYSDFNVCQTSC